MLRLRTFGGLSIERQEESAVPVAVAAGRRRLALLAVLAASDTGAVPRDKLLAVFWPESDTGRARHALDQTLYALKRDLGSDTLVTGREELSLNVAEITSDVGDFKAALEKRDHATAVRLYSGPFLDGVFIPDAADFERWTSDERASLERELEDAIEVLAHDAVARDDHREAARWWELLAERNPRRTRVVVALMSELAKSGDREGALRRAEIYHTLARADEDVEPNPSVAALAERLKKTPTAVAATFAAPAAPPPADSARTPVPAAPIADAPRENQRRHRLPNAAAMLAVGAALALSAAWAISTRADGSTRGWILPAQLDNRTGDSTFDHAIDALLRTGLEQSKVISVFPRASVQGTLARMGRQSGSARLDETLALEIARREGLSAVVAGSLDRLDSSYVIAVRLVDARTGVAMATEKAVARQRGDVIDAMDDIVRRLRKAIGESGSALARHDRPLPRATTRSLDALQKYADGLAAFDAGRGGAARMLWHEAVALDTNFAIAHAELGAFYYVASNRVAGDTHFERALARIDQLTDRERFQVRAAVASHRGNREDAIQIRRALLTEYPDDPSAWGSMGYDLMRLGRHREAIDALRRQIARDATLAIYHINLATALKATGDNAEAVRSYDRAFALQPALRSVNNVNHEYGSAFVRMRRFGEARTVFETMLGGDAENRAQGERSLAMLSMVQGKYGVATDHLRRAVVLSQRPGRQLAEARNHLFLAGAHREKGWADSARAEVLAAQKLFERAYLAPAFLEYLGKALARDGQVAAAVIVFDSLRRRARGDNPGDTRSVRVLAGELALAQGRVDSAVKTLRLTIAFDSSSLVVESYARALAASGDIAGAVQSYERLASRDSFGNEGEVLVLTVPRDLGLLYERLGDTTRARAMYQRLIEAWRDGDADLVALRQAREGLSRLRKTPR